MTIFLQFFRLSASFCPGAACPAVGPQAAQIPRQVGIAAPDMSGIQHPHAAPVPHAKARQHQCCPAPQVWCSHSGTMQFCVNDNIVKGCVEIIKDTNLLFMNKFSPKTLEEIEDMFVMLEGEQEKIYPLLASYDITDQIKESFSETISQLQLDEVYEVVYRLPKLNSDSMFVEMEKEPDNSVADEDYIETKKKELCDEYAKLFKDNEKAVNRAVLSAAISELPIFFNNISELQDFIYNTLVTCNDKAEKLACIEILNGIMQA